jgi:hypothetical protein
VDLFRKVVIRGWGVIVLLFVDLLHFLVWINLCHFTGTPLIQHILVSLHILPLPDHFGWVLPLLLQSLLRNLQQRAQLFVILLTHRRHQVRLHIAFESLFVITSLWITNWLALHIVVRRLLNVIQSLRLSQVSYLYVLQRLLKVLYWGSELIR